MGKITVETYPIGEWGYSVYRDGVEVGEGVIDDKDIQDDHDAWNWGEFKQEALQKLENEGKLP